MNRNRSFDLLIVTTQQSLAKRKLTEAFLSLKDQWKNSKSKSPQELCKILAEMWWFLHAWSRTNRSFPDHTNDKILRPFNQEIELFNQNPHYPNLPRLSYFDKSKEYIELRKDYTAFISCLVQEYLHINGLNLSFAASRINISIILYGGLRKAYLDYVKHPSTTFTANLTQIDNIIQKINAALKLDDQLKSFPQFLELSKILFDTKITLDALKDSLEAKYATLAYLLHQYEQSNLAHYQNVIASISPQASTLTDEIKKCSEEIREYINRYPIANPYLRQAINTLFERQSHLNLLPPSSTHFSRARQNDSQNIRRVSR